MPLPSFKQSTSSKHVMVSLGFEKDREREEKETSDFKTCCCGIFPPGEHSVDSTPWISSSAFRPRFHLSVIDRYLFCLDFLLHKDEVSPNRPRKHRALVVTRETFCRCLDNPDGGATRLSGSTELFFSFFFSLSPSLSLYLSLHLS